MFSDRFSVDIFTSFIRQERTINQFGNTNFSATQGIGDAVVLFKYKIWSTTDNSSVWQIGLGPKIPLGASDKQSDAGLTFNADLQPGSGAWDGVFFTQFSHVLKARSSMNFLLNATFGLKGKNDTYFATGISDRLLIGKFLIDPSLLLQYRRQSPDRIDGENLPSTGGNWVFVNPSIAYWPSPDLSFNIGVTVPVFSDITGTQVTPTHRFTTGIFYRFSKKREEILPNFKL